MQAKLKAHTTYTISLRYCKTNVVTNTVNTLHVHMLVCISGYCARACVRVFPKVDLYYLLNAFQSFQGPIPAKTSAIMTQTV